MRLGQISVVFLISKVLGSAFGFAATIYFARVLGEDTLGFYALVLSIVAWLTVLGRIGLLDAIVKRISEGNEREAYATAGAITLTAIGIIAAAGIVILQEHINSYVGRPVASLTAVIVFLTFASSFVLATLKGYHLVHVYAILSAARMGVRALIQIGLVAVGFRLTGLLIGYAAAAIIFTVVGLAILRIRPAWPSKRHFTSLFDFAKFSWLGGIRGKTFDQVDIIILGFFVQTGLIGVYSVAWSLSKFLDIFSSAVSTTLFPEMSETAAQNDPESISGLVEDALAFGGLIIVPGFVGGTVLADRLMNIYGDGFVVGEAVLPILIASLLIYTYNKQLLNALNAIDRPDLAFRSNAVFIATNVSLNVALIWQFGWIGAAVATALSAAVGLVFAFYYAKTHVVFTVPYGEIGRQWAAALGMGLVVSATRAFGEARWTWIPEYNAVFVVGLVGLGAAVYFAILFGISAEFRTTVANNLPFGVPFVGD